MSSHKLRVLCYAALIKINAYKKIATPSQKIIFVITNGRSGSSRLAKLFQAIDSVDSHHEPTPRFDTLMHDVSSNIELGRHFMTRLKFAQIARSTKPVYVETSHMFGKGYFEPSMQTGIPFSLILLKRNPRSVATSMYMLNTIPGRNKLGIRFYLLPNEAKFLQIEQWDRLSDYQLCFWHACEMEIRQKYYGRWAKEAALECFEVSTDQLNQPGVFEALLKKLNILVSDGELDTISRFRSLRINEKQDEKSLPYTLSDINFDAEEREILNLKRRIEEAYELE